MKKRTKEAIRKGLYEGFSEELRDLLFQEWEDAPQAVDIMTWIALFEFRAGKIVSFKRYASLVLRGVDEKWTRQDATLENTYERVPALYVLEGLMEANLMYGNYEEAYTLAMQLIGEGRTSDAVIRTSILSRYYMEGLKRALVVADVFIEKLHEEGLENIEGSIYLAKATAYYQEATKELGKSEQGDGPFLPEETEDIEAFGTLQDSPKEEKDADRGGEKPCFDSSETDLDRVRSLLLEGLKALEGFEETLGKDGQELKESILDLMEAACQKLPEDFSMEDNSFPQVSEGGQEEADGRIAPPSTQSRQSEGTVLEEPDFVRACEAGEPQTQLPNHPGGVGEEVLEGPDFVQDREAGEMTSTALEPNRQVETELLEEEKEAAGEEDVPAKELESQAKGEEEKEEFLEEESRREKSREDASTQELLRRCLRILKENGRIQEPIKPQEPQVFFQDVPLEMEEESETERAAEQLINGQETLEEEKEEPLPTEELPREPLKKEEAGKVLEKMEMPSFLQESQPEPEPEPPVQEEPQEEVREPAARERELSLEEKLDFLQGFAKVILEGRDIEQEQAYGPTYATFYLELRPYLAYPLQLRAAFIKLLMQDCPPLLYAEGGCISAEEFLGAWDEVFSQVKEGTRGAFLDTSLSRVFDNWVAEWSASQVKQSAENTNWKRVQIHMQEAMVGLKK